MAGVGSTGEMTLTEFEKSLIIGQIGENSVTWILRREQHNVERNCDGLVIDGRGPAMATPGGSIPRPDLAVSKRGVSVAVEVKTKCDRTTGIITGKVETGIDYQKWLDYQEYERQTGIPVMLVVPEYLFPGSAEMLLNSTRALGEWEKNKRTTVVARPDNILAQWLKELQPSLRHPTRCNGQEMIYFAVEQFHKDCLALLRSHIDSHATRLL
jgi:hypothetical protein